jgi:hypothetical protein
MLRMISFVKNIFKLVTMRQTINHHMTALMWMAIRLVGSQYINILSQGDKKREVSRIGTTEFFEQYKKYLQKYCNVADVSLKSFNRKIEEYKTFVKKIKSDGRMKYKIQWVKLMEHLQAQGYLYEYEEEDEEDSSSDEDD